MNPHVCLIVGWSVCLLGDWFIGRFDKVCLKFLNGREVTLPWSN